MKQAPHTNIPDPSDHPSEHDPGLASNSIRSGLVRWLKNFALYLIAVAVACATGIFFLWQIPILQELPQLVKNVSDPQTDRPSSATTALAPRTQTTPLQPASQTPATQQPPAPAGTIAVNTPPPETATEPAAEPSTPSTEPERQTTLAADQADSSAQPAETLAADASVPPTPKTEIEQLLADAQQQIDNRRLTAPASGNALRTYQRVLELEPNNPVAIEGIQRIATHYQDIAKQSLLQGRTDESLAYINRGLRAVPKNEALLNMRREARLAKQREEEQRQALLAERRRQEAEQMQELSRQPPPPLGEQPQQPWWQQQRQPSFNESGFNQR